LIVAAREIPELNHLADDPSNDGEVFAWQRQTPVCTLHDVKKPRKEDPPPVPITLARAENLTRPLAVSAEMGPGLGPDILLLVSCLRT
jgi:hypothetical protein